LRQWMGGRFLLLKAGAGSVGSSIVFFGATNLAVWAFSGIYARTLEGLAQCFALALPFFQNTAAGDLAWSLILFGSYSVAMALSRRSAARSGQTAAA